MDYPVYHPVKGWVYKDQSIDSDTAERLCGECGIPYELNRDRWIVLLDTEVAGIQFREDLVELVGELKHDRVLRLEREPENSYDRNAVKVLTGSGEMVGYIPRNRNTALANAMDNGVQIAASLRYASVDRIDISVMMHTTDPLVRRHVSRGCMYCNKVVVDSIPVNRHNIQFKDMSGPTRTIEYHSDVPKELIWDLMWGHRALEMEDKWNMFSEDDALFFCRSWTGHCIYKLELDDSGNHLLTTNIDNDVWNAQDERWDIDTVGSLIDDYLVSYAIGHTQTPLNMYGNYYVGKDEKWLWEMDADGRIIIKDPRSNCTGLFKPVD